MSIKIMNLVWEYAPYSGGKLLILLALADWSNEKGLSWPSVLALAEKARMERRSAQRIIRQMEEEGVLKITEGARERRSNVYHINIDKLLTLGATKCHPSQNVAGDTDDDETVTLVTGTATVDLPRATLTSPDPLDPPVNHQDEPLYGSGKKTSKQSAGIRIPEPFLLTANMRQWAGNECPDVDFHKATEEFVDYWRGVPGTRGKKLDWEATWRNRMRELQSKEQRFKRSNGHGQSNGRKPIESTFEFTPSGRTT